MHTALIVADEILKIAKSRSLSLTPMQLMKLVYIAHGWSLAVLNRDLFSDRIEAWKYGPVIPILYHATKKYGRSKVPLNLIDENAPSPFDQTEQSFLEDVVVKYGHLSGVQLSNLTHQPGTPWDQVYVPNVSNLEIPDHLIKQHYAEKLNEYRQHGAAATQ